MRTAMSVHQLIVDMQHFAMFLDQYGDDEVMRDLARRHAQVVNVLSKRHSQIEIWECVHVIAQDRRWSRINAPHICSSLFLCSQSQQSLVHELSPNGCGLTLSSVQTHLASVQIFPRPFGCCSFSSGSTTMLVRTRMDRSTQETYLHRDISQSGCGLMATSSPGATVSGVTTP